MAITLFYLFSRSNEKRRLALTVAFFTYIAFIRTFDITGTFLLLGEQIRDWDLALGSFSNLPLTGAPSTAGGRGFGPVYYWILWIGRHLIGPFTENLPHAGGLTVAMLQAIADTWLFWALWKRINLPLALAVCLIVATQPFDVGLSKAIWNPPVATSLVKMTMAQMLLLGQTPSLWRVAGVAATAWFSVQAHASGFFVAAPVFAALLAGAKAPALQESMGSPPLNMESDGLSRRWRHALKVAAVMAGVIFVLEIPYIIAQIRTPESKMGPTVVFDSLSQFAKFEIVKSFTSVVNITGELIVHKRDAWKFGLVTFIASAMAAWRWRKDAAMLAITVGPLVMTTLLLSTWTRPYESYWFMTIAAPMVLTLALVVTAIPRERIALWAALALLAWAVWWQPGRFEDSKTHFSYAPYRPLLAGSRTALKREPVLRVLSAAIPGVEPSTDVTYLYRILGGRIERGRPLVVEIQADGTVVFTPVR